MPSERNSSPNVDTVEPQSNNKVCSRCQLPLDGASTPVLLLHPDSMVCPGCRDRAMASRDTLMLPAEGPEPLCLERDTDIARHTAQAEEAVNHSYTTRPTPDERVLEHDPDAEAPSSPHPPSDPPYSTAPISVPSPGAVRATPSRNSSPFSVDHSLTPVLYYPSHTPADTITRRRRTDHSSTTPLDPLTDITRLRVRSQVRCCLYPGASFQGTQKSGRNSYDVNVTIVDVDLSTSFLCGYLRIRGLTDDWPELTTYFDAEIIGSRYGFLTQNWGASENDDLMHWSRFPAFRHVKDELKKPRLTMSDRDRGAVFMRWKERFLVPDHRVQDISGASFAGFYYVCVDFNPVPSASSAPVHPGGPDLPLAPDPMLVDSLGNVIPSKMDTQPPPRRDPSVRTGRPLPSPGPRASVPVATMSGFYFHQNSEPYQQLSLTHIPECTSSTFEFR